MQPKVPKVPCCTMARQPRTSLMHGLGESEPGLGPRVYPAIAPRPLSRLAMNGAPRHHPPAACSSCGGHRSAVKVAEMTARPGDSPKEPS